MTEPRTIGWVKTEHCGPCVDPFDKGAHMANGGIVNVRRQDEEDPPVMCEPCYLEVRELEGPPEDPHA